MIEVGFADPSGVARGKSSCCSREMDMDILFEISAKGMDGKKDTGKKALSLSPIFDKSGSNEGNTVQERTVQPEEDPEFFRHGKGNVLPGGIGKGIEAVFNPDVIAFLPQEGQNRDLQL
ncbi:MAG: hypothetical protein QY317_09860 [Candidatus Jettenia caeni]|nr:MAG: hypothetical protein QY317_09860 [Candidatus Jettenia caeni]